MKSESEFFRAFGAIVTAQRMRRYPTQKAAASALGMHPAKLCMIERGKVKLSVYDASVLGESLGIDLLAEASEYKL